MALDSQIGLVGRDDTAALIELLMRWRTRRHLPVLVAFGPGGSGKSALLDHVQRRYRDMPIARVNLDEAGSLRCEDILTAIFDDLRSFTHPEFGRIELPRYALARLAMMCESPGPEDNDPFESTRQLLARRAERLPPAARSFAEVAGLIPGQHRLGRVFRPLVHWFAVLGVIAPAWLRRFLVGATMAHALTWFERAAAGSNLLDLAEGNRVDAVFVRLRRLVHSNDFTDRTREGRERVDRLLVAAFVADIAEAFRGRRRRRTNCVVLLDGADLLEPFEYSMFESSRGVFPAPETDFLQLIAEARLAEPGAPLLVIATKQSSSELAEVEPEKVVPANGVEPTETEIAEARYAVWSRRFASSRVVGNSYFPLRLRPFTLAQTEQFVVEWNRKQGSTGASRILLAELHEVTKGHPLAVRLAIEAINLDYQHTMVQPAVRSVFAQRIPGEAAQIGDYLLARFLQRFRVGEEVEERVKTRAVLARLAAPKLIDEQVIALLTPDLDPRDTFLRLRHYSFAELFERDSVVTDPQSGAHPVRDRYLTLHPLLRDLLARTLLSEPAPGLLSYQEVHTLLRQRYHDDHNRAAELYHTLALGDVGTVAAQLKQDVQASRAGWPAMLEQIAEAPTQDRSQPRRIERLDRLRHRFGATVRREAGTVRDLVEDMWRLRSATSTAQHSVETFERIAKDYLELGELVAPENDTTALDERDNYQRLAETSTDLPRNAEPLPSYVLAEEKFPYPSVLFKPRTVHRAAIAVVVLLLAGYLTVFGVQLSNDCISGNPLNAISLGSSVLNPTTTLNKTSTGECVGVTDSVGTFAYASGDSTDPTEVDEVAEINALSTLIYQQNQRVVDQTDASARLPYVTVVVATMLSSANQQPFLDLSVGVNELRGVYLAQEQWNQLDTAQRKPPFLVRILLSNFGGDSLYAAQAAAQIQQLAEHDSSVLAVTGMGQTREQTVAAATVLGTATGTWTGIPVITSAPSGDALADKDYVFMTAATNDRQADVGTAFVQSQFPNRRLFVIYDPNDLYSSDLQSAYTRSLADAGLPPAMPEIYDADSTDTRQSLSSIVADICSHNTAQAPLILYAGRANELPTFMDLLQGNTCDQRAVVLGDDDLTQEETNGYADLTSIANFVDSRLYFTSFGPTKDGWQQLLAKNTLPADLRSREQSAETNFFTAYAQIESMQHAEGGKAYQSPPNGHIMLAYDAVNLAVAAIEGGVSGTALPTRDQVYGALRAMVGSRAYAGVSGPIDFGTTDPTPLNKGGYDATKLVVVQQVRKDPISGKLGSAYVYSQP
ncbi:MAG TPA: hypothetical protein VG247_23810 [Pseudonocardiaceae bacterium]|nr:hypothetical protein [Pseudonocardiaceae bacterium]